ncbi:hypothetical protein AB6A40_009387 [Gnathostoma spinigerum]|uniref:Transthyretin-like family protein n=1 Tax=Gnathostoma spinigerum TaxID=75299 RepID=A0ABD6EZT1_9BILA
MRSLTLILLLFTVVAVNCSLIGGGHQSVRVIGKLRCGHKPASGVRVKLWEEDTGPDPDDLLAQGYTDAQGNFDLQGSEFEVGQIDPVLKIYHECNDEHKPGSRKVKFKIPKRHITRGKVPKSTYDLGEINLETHFPGEEREWITS